MTDQADTSLLIPRAALLADGTVTRIRPLAPEDVPALAALNERLSERSFYLRYFTLGRRAADGYVAHLLRADHDHLALVAELHGEIAAVGSYEQLADPSRAEVAFVVADAHQAKGLGTLLLEHLAAIAETRGITHFVASALVENRQMLDVFSRSGYDVVPRREREVVEIEFPVAVTDRLLDTVAERERLADARSIRRLFFPQTVAVIGAGRREGNVGNAVIRNLVAAGFTGRVVPINPNAETIRGSQAYPRISDVPGIVDLAVIAVPAEHVVDVVRECAACGVADVVVLSSGFAEAGTEGRAREVQLLEACRAGGMRLVGPNCIGIANTDPAVCLDATFAPVAPRRGPIGMMTQSGAVGIVALRRTVEQHLGLSTFASVGNKADVSGNDLLMYWENDPVTRVIALYLESFGNPQKFARIARRVSRRKPIIALVSGRSAAGARAARSHTARTVTSAVAVDALLAQTGVIGAGSLEELLYITALLAHQPPPEGRRVAIVGNSGGPGVLAADVCGVEGLEVVQLGLTARRALEQLPGVAAANPVDLGAGASPAALERAVRAVLADPGVDSVMVLWTPVFDAGPQPLVRALGAALNGAATPKPVVAVQLAGEAAPAPLDVGQGTVIPAFAYPEHAARALRRAADYGRWQRQPPVEGFQPEDLDRDAARGLVGQVLHGRPEGGWLDAQTAKRSCAATASSRLRRLSWAVRKQRSGRPSGSATPLR